MKSRNEVSQSEVESECRSETFFYLAKLIIFNTPVRTAHPSAEPNLVTTSMSLLAKEIGLTRKT